MSNKELYLFDFDGTISNRDSFMHFFIKVIGFRIVALKLLFNFPKILFVFFTNKELSKTKELITSIMLKGKSKSEIMHLGKNYVENFINDILRSEALIYIKNLLENKNDVYIVSASLSIWLLYLSEALNVNLICTEIEYKENIFTGKFKTKNCKGIEKVRRIKKEIKIKEYSKIIAFGDSSGDKEMFEMSTEFKYKPFRY